MLDSVHQVRLEKPLASYAPAGPRGHCISQINEDRPCKKAPRIAEKLSASCPCKARLATGNTAGELGSLRHKVLAPVPGYVIIPGSRAAQGADSRIGGNHTVLSFSLCPISIHKPSFPYRCCCQKNCLKKTLHANLCLRSLFPGEPDLRQT